MMNNDRPTFYIDIETTGTESNRVLDYVIGNVSAPKNYKDPEKIAAYIAEKRDSAWTDTATKPHFGRPACIGTAVNSDEPEVIADDNEHALLSQWFRFVRSVIDDNNKRQPLWVGWNVMFDLRMLWARALIQRVDVLGVNLHETAQPWASNSVLDLKWRMTGERPTSKTGLIDWCIGLDIDVPHDKEILGPDIPKAWTVDALRPQVMEHCRRDVLRCQLIHERLREIGYE